MNHQENLENWIYLKLYLGKSTDRMDGVIVNLGRQLSKRDGFARWFYLRYFDTTGFHLRLRVQPVIDEAEHAGEKIQAICTTVLNGLHDILPSEYRPMVTPTGSYDPGVDDLVPGGAVRIVQDDYEPEFEKYGGPIGMPIAEELFMASSEIATEILADEATGRYSRKTLAPCLMYECFRAFQPAIKSRYWRQYSLFWLGGDTPAAQDWREKFFRKGRELQTAGEAVCSPDAGLPTAGLARLIEWRRAVQAAHASYREAGSRIATTADVLCFNFSHLMMNRLGLTALEEAYLASLLQQSEPAEAWAS